LPSTSPQTTKNLYLKNFKVFQIYDNIINLKSKKQKLTIVYGKKWRLYHAETYSTGHFELYQVPV